MSNEDDEHEQQRWLGHLTNLPDMQRRASSAPFIGEARREAQAHDTERLIQQQGLSSWYHNDFTADPYTATSMYQWQANYVSTTTPGEDFTSMPGYVSGSATDNDSTSALDDLFYQQRVAQLQPTFDESYTFPPISGGRMPESLQMSSSVPLPQGGSGMGIHGIPAVSAAFVVPSSIRASPSPIHVSPATTPALPSAKPADAKAATSSRGKKRVRESTPAEEAYVTPARADVKRLHQATPRAKKTKTGSESSYTEPTRTPDPPSGAGAPWSGNTPTPTPAGEAGESSSAVAQHAGRKRGFTPGTRKKIEEVRSSGACWRCRRYKKPCNNRTGTCDTCLTSGFRIWPASLGCRRGDTQEFVEAILPSHLEEVLEDFPPDLPRPHTWRPSLEPRLAPPPSPADDRPADKWDHLCAKILGTRLYGQEFVELFEIMAQYQRDAAKEDPMLNLVAASLSYEVDFYHQFINLGPTTAQPPTSSTSSASATVVSLRASLANTFSTWLSLCLRGRMHDFPVAYLSAVLSLCGLIIFSDTIVALKQQTGSLIWPVDARDQMVLLRRELLTITLDLLGVVAKGAKPLRFRCWRREESAAAGGGEAGGEAGSGAGGKGQPERSAEGMRLIGGNVAAFEAMASLQRWIRRWHASLGDDAWFEAPPFTPGIRPIQALSRFIKMGHGDLEEA